MFSMRFARYNLIFICSCALPITFFGQADTISSGLFVTPLDKFVSFNYLYQDPSAKISLNTSATWDVREVPGNIMIYTSDDILASGASDLMGFLQLIPGLSITEQRDQTPGLTIRGIPGNEGRVLIAINNVSLNETGIGSTAFAQRVNLQNIARIELTYGPGNIVSGSGAFLAHINLITKNANESENALLTGGMNLTQNGLSLSEVGVSGNHFAGKDATITYSIRRSNGIGNIDFNKERNGSFFSIVDTHRISNAEALMQLVTKNFSVGYFESQYSPGFSPDSYKIQSHARSLDLSHARIGKNSFSHRNKLSYTQQSPWQYLGVPDSIYSLTNLSFIKTSFSSVLTFNFMRRLYLSALFEVSRTTVWDDMKQFIPTINRNNWLKNDNAVYTGVSGLDILYTTKIGIFNIATRSEWGTLSKLLISPRFSYSLLKGPMHFKFIMALSNRVPEIRNFIFTYPGDSILPEKLKSVQIQTGYRLSNLHKLVLNGYYSNITNPIKQFYGEILKSYYANLGQVNSYGFELSYEIKFKKFDLTASYTWNQIFSKQSTYTLSDINLYNANDHFGAPVNSLSIRSNLKIKDRSNLILSGLFQGTKEHDDKHDDIALNRYYSDPSLIVNILYRAKLGSAGRVNLELGVLNALNQNQYLCCSADDTNAPVNISTRQYRVALSYSLLK